MPLFDFIWDLLNNTPWWVYLIFAYAITIGIQSSKPQTVAIQRMFLIPILLIALSLQDLIFSVQPSFAHISTWALTTFIGSVIGWWQIQGSKIKVDKKHHLIRTHGTWSVLIIILVIFSAKYYFGYELKVHPEKIQNAQFTFSLLAISGICAGLFLGRLLCYIFRMLTGPQVNLKS